MGQIEIKCSPEGATVRLLEVRRSPKNCPARFSELPIGHYTVLVEADGHRSVRRPIKINAAAVSVENITLVMGRNGDLGEELARPKVTEVEAVTETLHTSPAFLMTVGGGTAVATGFVAHLIALQTKASIEDKPPGPERDEKLDAYETQRTLTILGYGVGGALLGTGLYLMFEDELGLSQRFMMTPGGIATALQF